MAIIIAKLKHISTQAISHCQALGRKCGRAKNGGGLGKEKKGAYVSFQETPPFFARPHLDRLHFPRASHRMLSHNLNSLNIS